MTTTPRTPSAPGSTSSLRAANQSRVLGALRSTPPDEAPTQAELARLTGLAPATVSNIVRELSTAGLVESEPGSGRRGSSVRLSAAAGLVAGVDFGHSHVAVAVGRPHRAGARRGAGPDQRPARPRRGARARLLDPAPAARRPRPAAAGRARAPGSGQEQRRALGRDLPRLGGRRRRRRRRGGLRRPRAGRERRQPRRPGRAPAGQRPGPRHAGLRQDRQRRRRRHRRRRPPLPRRRRHGRRDRPPHHQRPGPDVPLRQPRLPGDLHLERAHPPAGLGHAPRRDAAGPRRRGHRRQRVGAAGAGGRRAPPGLGAGQRGQPAQPVGDHPRRGDGRAPATCCSTPPGPGCAGTRSTRSPRPRSSRASSAAGPAWWARCCSPPSAPSWSAD